MPRLSRLAFALALALVLGSLVIVGQPTRVAADVAVAMKGFQFVGPDGTSNLTVPVGTRVTWTNSDAVNHTTTSDMAPPLWDSGSLPAGASFSFTFNQAGTFPYHCIFHGAPGVGMHGTVTVMPAGAAASLSASPQNVPFGQFTTTITFATGNGTAGTVCVAANNSAASPFAGNPSGSGSAVASFIQSGSYLFTLHSGGDCTGATLATITVQKLTPDGTANPSITGTLPSFTVQPGILTNTGTVNWDTGTGANGLVTVSVNGTTPLTLAMADFGTVSVPWIQSGVYTFTLTAGAITKTATITTLAGIAASPTSAAAPAAVTVTANSGTGAPVLICLQAGDGTSVPFALGNSGIANGMIGSLGKNAYVFTAFRSADGKTPITSVATGMGGAQCTANTPLMVVPNPDASPAQIIVSVT